jgi:hypothetical protein
MKKLHYIQGLAAILAAGAIAVPAMGQDHPSAKITFHGGSVGFIIGAHTGGGTLTYKGKHYELNVSGLGVGEIGVTSYNAEGEVYNLHNLKDIEGVYGAASAGATAGAGAGAIDMTNGNGVEIRAHVTTSGLNLKLAASGVNIALK